MAHERRITSIKDKIEAERSDGPGLPDYLLEEDKERERDKHGDQR